MSGFTLVEVLISIAILTVIAGFGLFISVDFYKSNILSSERDAMLSVLRRARGDALDNVLANSHGVYIDSSNYTLFLGNSYASRTVAYDQTVPRQAGVTITGLSEIVFSQLLATSTASGTLVLSDGVRSSTVQVNNEGRISW